MQTDALATVSWRARPQGFVALMALYESNYVRLGWITGNPGVLADVAVSRVEGDCELLLRTLERSRYTTTIELTYLDQTGQQAELVQSVAVKLQPPVEGAAPIERDARRVGPGQYQWTGAAPIPGTWRVTITSRVTQFEQKTTTFDLTIP